MSRARFRAHGFRAQHGLYLAANFPLKFQKKSQGWGAPAGGSPPLPLVKTEEGNRLIPREIRLQENGTERFRSAVSCP